MRTKYILKISIVSIALITVTLYVYIKIVNKSTVVKDNQVTTSERNASAITPNPSPTLTPTPSPIPTPTPDIYKGLNKKNFYITYYGFPDNDPPGDKIAYPKNRVSGAFHNQAGGIGTYSDPITFASDPAYIEVGTIYYLPYLKKYIVMEDYCESCSENLNEGKSHIDIWMQSKAEFEDELIDCQRKWTRKSEIVITNPSPNLPVSSSPLFDPFSGVCK